MHHNIFIQSIIVKDIPKWIDAIPFESVRKWGIYFFNYPLVFLGLIILMVASISLIIIIILNNVNEATYGNFTIKPKGKRAKQKDIKKVGKIVDEQESKIDNLKQENAALVKKNQSLIDEMERSEADYLKLKDYYRQLIKGVKKFHQLYDGVKNAIYYLTTQNPVFNAAMVRNPKDEAAIHDFYHELSYYLHQCLNDKGEDVRISIMRFNKASGLLQIVWKHGMFNCNLSELVLPSGEGLAGFCLDTGNILNVPNVKMKFSEVAASDELLRKCLEKYIPSKFTNLTVSSLHIPIFVLGNTEGVINITSPRENAFIEEDELIAQLFAEKISRAWTVENSKKKR